MSVVTPHSGQGGQSGNAVDRWMSLGGEILITGTCTVSIQQCHIDFDEYGIAMGYLQEHLTSLGISTQYDVACNKGKPCLRDGDWCSWRSHPPQNADCQTDKKELLLHVIEKTPGGDGTVVTGNVHGVPVTAKKLGEGDWVYNIGKTAYPVDLDCIRTP
ncbi:hypothetical protein JDV02_005607 [Purpureocillium takamizusanense]|uniref:Uncharacterized protein n=1 Tax=Purpureocillium takamizusanense TaxID=2060973 RepID=A0A9Q8QGT9_9HYPO|nr:uncharacterized protein JDV02_005607 [Purpureocillium takamizusanense]UNI19423.1 hypothetical protein JDV02_005607 [Purpureocillium takamizusanense]